MRNWLWRIVLETLKDIRLQHGLSQVDLSVLSGVAQNTISDIETGRRDPRPSTLRRLAKALSVEVGDFYPEMSRRKAIAPPPSLAEWLKERCDHAFLAMDKAALVAMFEDLDDAERRELGLAINHEYNEFCAFPSNVTAAERVLMRRTIRDSISEVAVKHQLALHESGLYPEYTDELRRVFELERTLDAEAEIA
jgi:transcriptional regulator with XRE-family HTH domain